MRSLVYLVAVAEDGFIAEPDGGFGCFVDTPELLAALLERVPDTFPTTFRRAHGIDGSGSTFDAVLMGRRTYEVGLPFGVTSPYSHLDQYVVSSSMRTSPDPEVHLVGDDPVRFVQDLKQQPGQAIWLCGGGRLAASLVEEIDELVLKRHPVLTGGGVPLFDGATGVRRFDRVTDDALPDGVRLTRLRPRRSE